MKLAKFLKSTLLQWNLVVRFALNTFPLFLLGNTTSHQYRWHKCVWPSVLLWASPNADYKTRTWVQVVNLGGDPRSTGERVREVKEEERKVNKGCANGQFAQFHCDLQRKCVEHALQLFRQGWGKLKYLYINSHPSLLGGCSRCCDTSSTSGLPYRKAE